jgi:hypothetical protein
MQDEGPEKKASQEEEQKRKQEAWGKTRAAPHRVGS